MLAMLLSNVTHEGLGHGGACLLVGGRPTALSSAWLESDLSGVSAWGQRAEAAGGTLANVLLGAILMGWLHVRRPATAQAYYFVWLAAVVNLLQGGGYLLTSPFFGFGDWKAFLAGLEPQLVWKVGLTSVGLAISCVALWAGVRSLTPLLPASGEAKRVARLLAWLPYLVIGGGVFTLAAALNPLGPGFMLTTALAHLGGCAWLAWLPEWVRPGTVPGALGAPRPSRGWRVAGAIALLAVFALGRGVSF
jgi:hypothetical protein